MGRLGEGLRGLVGLAVARLGHDVVVCPLTEHGTAGQGARQIDHRRQFLVIDEDRLGRVAGLLTGLRDHRDHRLTHEADPLVSQGAPRRGCGRGTPGAGESGDAGQGFAAGVDHLLTGQHQQHARHGARRRGIDRDDTRMGIRRSHKGQMMKRLLGKLGQGRLPVIGETALATQKRVIFHAGHALTTAKAGGLEKGGLIDVQGISWGRMAGR